MRENSGILTIITSNNPELLDEAVKNRPKRFDTYIEFPNPEFQQRKEILIDILSNRIDKKDLYLIDAIVQKLDGLSCAHVKEFGERLVLKAIYQKEEFICHEGINKELDNLGFEAIGNKNSVGFEANCNV